MLKPYCKTHILITAGSNLDDNDIDQLVYSREKKKQKKNITL